MIFVFSDGDADRGFWMKDTITPLDMVFVKSDGTISAIAVNVPATAPKTTDDKIARRQAIAKYVIELGAHDSERVGLDRKRFAEQTMEIVAPQSTGAGE